MKASHESDRKKSKMGQQNDEVAKAVKAAAAEAAKAKVAEEPHKTENLKEVVRAAAKKAAAAQMTHSENSKGSPLEKGLGSSGAGGGPAYPPTQPGRRCCELCCQDFANRRDLLAGDPIIQLTNDVSQIKRAVMGGETVAAMTGEEIVKLVRRINGAPVEDPPKGPDGFCFINQYPHNLVKATDEIGKSCHLSHCFGKAGASFNLCQMQLKKEEEKAEQQAPNIKKRPAPRAEQNRVNYNECFCQACELVFHPSCSALWHALVFMGADAFLETPCWYCQDMVRDFWEPQSPAVKPHGAKEREKRGDKRPRAEEAPAVQEEDNSKEEDKNEGGGGKQMFL